LRETLGCAASALRLGCCVTFGTSGHTTIGPTGAGTWSPFTNITQGSFTAVLGSDQLTAGVGTLQYTGTLSPAAADWTALAVSYNAAAAPAVIPPPNRQQATPAPPSPVPWAQRDRRDATTALITMCAGGALSTGTIIERL